MLQTETIINELDQYLEVSGLYSSGEDKAEVLSEDVRSTWKDRFAEAIKHDFLHHCQVQVSVTDDYFELFGDQGATVWPWKSIAYAWKLIQERMRKFKVYFKS